MIYLAKYSLGSGPVSQICLFWFGQIKKKNECKVVAGKRNKKSANKSINHIPGA